jgi:nitric oxide synthase oxygenase domain/subunit
LQLCQKLGWKGKFGKFDVLPLVLSGHDGEPHLFEIPDDIIMRVKIKHPDLEGLTGLGLEWYALPAVSGMLLEIGGIQFPACPFSGWYALSEIATRDLLDVQRYNLLNVSIPFLYNIKLCVLAVMSSFNSTFLFSRLMSTSSLVIFHSVYSIICRKLASLLAMTPLSPQTSGRTVSTQS